MKRSIKVPVALVLVAVFALLLLLSLTLVRGSAGHTRDRQIKEEVFSYVQRNQHQIPLDDTTTFQEFYYTSVGFSDAGVAYGYYYSPEDEYRFKGSPYRDGYLRYGTPNNGEDWYYHERICENWYYFEEHFG